MLGLLTLGLTVFMIFKLVKNALIGKQLGSDVQYAGTIELIIPVTNGSHFYMEPWIAMLKNMKALQGHLKIHVLVDGHHPALSSLGDLHAVSSCVEVQSFLTRPTDTDAVPWMIEQIASRVTGTTVILGDSELVPTETAFLSLAKLVTEKQKAFFVLPQTAKLSVLGEAIAVLNPTLALASIFGFRKFRRNISHPLMSIASGWMGMPLKTFKELNFHHVHVTTWKEAVVKQWDREEKDYVLAFGEKQLRRYYPNQLGEQFDEMKNFWSLQWERQDKKGFWIFILALFVWSFPMLFFVTHPFWSLASILLLGLYRFFSKIVFQESWLTIILHPVGCLVWIASLILWAGEGLRTKYMSQGPKKLNS
jgi:hypothetical protein